MPHQAQRRAHADLMHISTRLPLEPEDNRRGGGGNVVGISCGFFRKCGTLGGDMQHAGGEREDSDQTIQAQRLLDGSAQKPRSITSYQLAHDRFGGTDQQLERKVACTDL